MDSMDDIDRALARLACAPVPAGLDGLEARVLARIGTRPIARQTGLGVGVIAGAALVIGMVGASLPSTASAVAPLSPLSGNSPLAPSTLLAGTP